MPLWLLDPSPSLAGSVRHGTQGQPLFVCQFLRQDATATVTIPRNKHPGELAANGVALTLTLNPMMQLGKVNMAWGMNASLWTRPCLLCCRDSSSSGSSTRSFRRLVTFEEETERH